MTPGNINPMVYIVNLKIVTKKTSPNNLQHLIIKSDFRKSAVSSMASIK